MSGQIYFHLHEESNKTIRASPEKTCDEVNLPVTAKTSLQLHRTLRKH